MIALKLLLAVLYLACGVHGKLEQVNTAQGGAATADDSLDAAAETCRAPGDCGVGDAEEEPACFDDHSNCDLYATRRGGLKESCIVFYEDMSKKCRKSCQFCDNTTPNQVSNIYSESPQQIKGSETDKLWEYSAKVDDYMYNSVYDQGNETFSAIRVDCQNRHELCLFWAAIGECEANPKYMLMNCSPSCFSCEQLSFETRCPYDKEAPMAWSKLNDLDNMFRRIVSDEQFQQYQPTIYSKPDASKQENEDGVLTGPWVVTLDDFLTPEECDILIDMGAEKGYERSRDVGAKRFDGTYDGKESTGRTSSNAWCTEECWENPTSSAIHDRIENLLQIPRENYEYLQLLKYEVGQFYETHHDYIDHHNQRSPGVRILTIFLYLNDVEEGGGTNFPLLNQTTVYPKRGRALIWPSVKTESPNRKDRRTEHQALPVIAGIKYGANAWVHQRDFKEPWAKGCH